MLSSILLRLPVLLPAALASIAQDQAPLAVDRPPIPSYTAPPEDQELTGILALGDSYASGSASLLSGKKYAWSWPQILTGNLGTDLAFSGGFDVAIGDVDAYTGDYSHSQLAVLTTGFDHYQIARYGSRLPA